MTTDAPTDLHRRTGLPADIAYLRATHPQPTWHGHGNFGELADFWLRVHDSLRTQGDALQRVTQAFREDASDPAAFQRIFVSRFNHFLQHLTGHHQIEDAAYFPKFRALDPRMVAGFDLLEHDHIVIHRALTASIDSTRALLAALPGDHDTRRRGIDLHADAAEHLLALLRRHLADEEELVIPAMLEHGERSLG